ncbi:MAG: DUF1800 domain-containing protein [Chloracidobacterium sp.]
MVALSALAGCRQVVRGWLDSTNAAGAPVGSQSERRRAIHVLNRLAYGATPQTVNQVVTVGVEAFLEEQLSPASIPDLWATWLARRIEAIHLDAPAVFDFTNHELLTELRRAAIVRAVYSRRALYETMVAFWNDFFNIYAGKGDGGRLLVVYDRTAIRPHALGRFHDLLRATATSPAMLVYLDGQANARGRPNENYARELLELHTLGVNGGYAQADVREAARALTGWRVREGFRRGQVVVAEDEHDGQPKVVLGCLLEGGDAASDLEALLDCVASHPATARHVAWRLCRRFVADEPPASLVAAVAAQFARSQGDIRSTLQTLIHADAFMGAPPRLKRPFAFVVSALRLLLAETDGGPPLQARIAQLGQLPFDCPTPDGFPEDEARWQFGLLGRWNLALALARGEVRGTTVNTSSLVPARAASEVWGRSLTADEQRAFDETASADEQAALFLCAPDFQYA